MQVEQSLNNPGINLQVRIHSISFAVNGLDDFLVILPERLYTMTDYVPFFPFI